MYINKRLGLVFLLLITATLVLSIAVQARPLVWSEVSAPVNAPAPVDDLVVSTTVSAAEQAAALAFWTRERIAATQPMEMPSQVGPAEIDVSAQSEMETYGPPDRVKAGAPAPDADGVAQAAYAADWLAIAEALGIDAEALDEGASPDMVDSPTGTSQVYTSYTINKISAAVQKLYPHRFVGRLSFRTPSGTSYCSATSINGNVMLTAAHCLYDTTNNRWYSNWAFTPAYRNGNAPYGVFPARQCWVLTAWVNLGGSYNIPWAQHDVGVCKMGTNSAGQTLNNAVGWMGREWNYSYVRHVHNLGYPFRNYNNNLIADAGKYLVTCVAETWQQATEVRGMGCNWGGGISGGPWVRDYAQGVVSGYATGVNSGIYIGTQNIYGARFNSNNIVPLCTAAGC